MTRAKYKVGDLVILTGAVQYSTNIDYYTPRKIEKVVFYLSYPGTPYPHFRYYLAKGDDYDEDMIEKAMEVNDERSKENR